MYEIHVIIFNIIRICQDVHLKLVIAFTDWNKLDSNRLKDITFSVENSMTLKRYYNSLCRTNSRNIRSPIVMRGVCKLES
jgi:hypothetical protein